MTQALKTGKKRFSGKGGIFPRIQKSCLEPQMAIHTGEVSKEPWRCVCERIPVTGKIVHVGMLLDQNLENNV